jgi:hypothetical protein
MGSWNSYPGGSVYIVQLGGSRAMVIGGARHGKVWGGSHDNPRGSLNNVYKDVVKRTIAPCPRIPSPWICCLLWVYALSS